MKAKPSKNQLAFDLFGQRKTHGNPSWDDVQKGRAVVVDSIEPCDGKQCTFWQGGECVHVLGKYAFPKKRPNGMCLKHRLVWND